MVTPIHRDIKTLSQEWWCMPVIPIPRKQRLESCKFKASLGYLVRLCLQKTKGDGVGESMYIMITITGLVSCNV
jgi:hypothetical protein